MAKSRDAFRTISEVSTTLDTPTHVLRFWESKFSQIKPVKRAGGRRYYRPDDIKLLSGIKELLHGQGMTIKGVQKLLREKSIKYVIAQSTIADDVKIDGGDDQQILMNVTSHKADFAAKIRKKATASEPDNAKVVPIDVNGPTGEPQKTALTRRTFPKLDQAHLEQNIDRIRPLIAQLEAVRDRMRQAG